MLCVLGDWAGAVSLLRGADELVKWVGMSWFAAYPMVQLADLYLNRDELERADSLATEVLALTQKTNDLQAMRWAQGRLAELDLIRFEPERARERILSVTDRPGLEESDVPNFLPILARAELAIGKVDEPARVAQSAVDRARRQHDGIALVDALRVRGAVSSRQGDADMAVTCVAESLELAQSMQYALVEGLALRELALVHSRDGLSPTCATYAADAVRVFHRIGARMESRRTRSLLGIADPVA